MNTEKTNESVNGVKNEAVATATVTKILSARFVPGDASAIEEYRRKDSVVVNLDKPVAGHGIDANGIRVQKDVTTLWLDPKLFVALCLNADDRLPVVIGNKSKIDWLTVAVTNANVAIKRELTVIDDVEHYSTSFEKITFPKNIEAGIERGFNAFFLP